MFEALQACAAAIVARRVVKFRHFLLLSSRRILWTGISGQSRGGKGNSIIEVCLPLEATWRVDEWRRSQGDGVRREQGDLGLRRMKTSRIVVQGSILEVGRMVLEK